MLCLCGKKGPGKREREKDREEKRERLGRRELQSELQKGLSQTWCQSVLDVSRASASITVVLHLPKAVALQSSSSCCGNLYPFFFFLLFYNCGFATVMDHNVSI